MSNFNEDLEFKENIKNIDNYFLGNDYLFLLGSLYKSLIYSTKFPEKIIEKKEKEIVDSFEFFNQIFHQEIGRKIKYFNSNFKFREKNYITISLINLNTNFISSNVPNDYKLLVIHLEMTNILYLSDSLLEVNKQDFFDQYFEERFHFLVNYLINYESLSSKSKLRNLSKDIIYKFLARLIDQKIDYYCMLNKVFDVYFYLRNLLSNNSNDCQIVNIIINQIVILNSNFVIDLPEELEIIIDENSHCFNKHQLEMLKTMVNQNVNSVKTYHTETHNGDYSPELFKKYKDRNIFTIVDFTIPFEIYKDYELITIDPTIEINFYKITSYLNDPIYKKYKGTTIGNLGIKNFCDTDFETKKTNTIVRFVIKKFFNPELEQNENISKEDLMKKNYEQIKNQLAINGRIEYPHKKLIITTLRDNIDRIKEIMDIELDKVNINLFNSYLVDYIDINTNSKILESFYPITNPDQYEKSSKKFLDRLNELNLKNNFSDIKELIKNIDISNGHHLNQFIIKLINITIKKNIEMNKNYQYCWNESKKPQSEPKIQPLIKSNLQAICDFMGIQISREVESSNGSIDFLCTYTTKGGNLLKCCIELKNAHNAKIEEGLTKQLPEYLKGEGTKYGIYLILWYKGNDFDDPKNFNNKDELLIKLDEIKDTSLHITNIIIDCNKPISPSKLK